MLSRPSAGLVLAALVLVPALARADGDRYTIDPEHLSIGFLVHHVGYANVLGMFRKAEGSYVFDEESGELSALEVRIEADSVFSNHRRRDDHLRGPDFLDARKHPRLVYRADSARLLEPGRFAIDGTLELLGVERPVSLEATWNRSAEYPFPVSGGGTPWVMGVSATGSFKRSDFGMTYAVANGWVGDEIELIIEFEARRE